MFRTALYGFLSLIAMTISLRILIKEGVELKFVIFFSFEWYYIFVPF